MDRSKLKDAFDTTFTDYYDFELKTRSLHGHKCFTTWEWEMNYKLGFKVPATSCTCYSRLS